MLKDTEELLEKHGYRIVYVPHDVIEDYNATYNVICEDQLITTGAAKALGIPMNEIWISKKWKPFAKYIIFHELREIYYRSKGVKRDEVHERTRNDESELWKNDPLWLKMNRDMKEMDEKTAEAKGYDKF
jgi:competence protein ComEA